MRRVAIRASGQIRRRAVRRVTDLAALGSEWLPNVSFLVRVRTEEEFSALMGLAAAGVSGITALADSSLSQQARIFPTVLTGGVALEDGDVVAVSSEQGSAEVL